MILRLPLPPSRNVTKGLHPMVLHKAKRKYRKKAWAAAIAQEQPHRDPPEHVTVRAHFKLYGPLRDEDGLDLKWVLDALRQKQTGNLRWRQGLYDECGYFIDDDPAHLTLEAPTQEIDRKDRALVLTLEVA